MPLHVAQGVDIPLKRSPNRELRKGFLDETVAILPVETALLPGEPNRRLGIETVSQQPRKLWCWAACAEMVLRFFGVAKDKCSVAGVALHMNNCCPSSIACDQGLSVEGIDSAFGSVRLAGDRFVTLTFEEIRAQISGDPPRPVVAGIQWHEGGGHLVVISGWRISADGSIRYLKVNDPFYTSGDIRYEDFVDKYGPNDNGRWVHTWANFRKV